MEAELIIYLASAALSLAFEYFPRLEGWYNRLADKYQQLIMLGLLTLAVAAAFGASCLGLDSWYVCDQGGLFQALKDLLVAIGINQGVFKLLPKKR